MGIGVFSRTFEPGGDDSWMGSRHGVSNARTGTLKASAFPTGTYNGVVRSGTPVAEDAQGYLIPYDSASTTGAEVLAGFVIDDRDVTEGDEPCALLWHGRIITANLPVAFTAPTAPTAFVFD